MVIIFFGDLQPLTSGLVNSRLPDVFYSRFNPQPDVPMEIMRVVSSFLKRVSL